MANFFHRLNERVKSVCNFLKILFLKFLNLDAKIAAPLIKMLLFILKMAFWTFVLYLLLLFFLVSFKSIFGDKVKLSDSDVVLFITAVFVLAYTYEAHRLKEETIFQRRMSAAADVNFQMNSGYIQSGQYSEIVGILTSPKSQNNVSIFTFVSPFLWQSIGECSLFYNYDGAMSAQYMIKDVKEYSGFLKAIEIQNGEIKAKVLITNGERFIYTYRAIGDNWKKSLGGERDLCDSFILVKKEIG